MKFAVGVISLPSASYMPPCPTVTTGPSISLVWAKVNGLKTRINARKYLKLFTSAHSHKINQDQFAIMYDLTLREINRDLCEIFHIKKVKKYMS